MIDTFKRYTVIITAIGATLTVLGGGAAWAQGLLDQRYDQRYVTSDAYKRSELRQVKREAKRAELACQAGHPESCGMYEYLMQEIRELEEAL